MEQLITRPVISNAFKLLLYHYKGLYLYQLVYSLKKIGHRDILTYLGIPLAILSGWGDCNNAFLI